MLSLLSKPLWSLGFVLRAAVGDGGQGSVVCGETAYYGMLGESGICSSEPCNTAHFTFPEASLRIGLF